MNKTKMLIIISIILILLIILTGCENKKCIESHEEDSICLQPYCMPNGKGMSCYNLTRPCKRNVCDRWEEQ